MNILDKLFRKNVVSENYLTDELGFCDECCLDCIDNEIKMKKLNCVPKLVQYDITYNEAIELCQEKKLYIPTLDELELILRTFKIVPKGFLWSSDKSVVKNDCETAGEIFCIAISDDDTIIKNTFDKNRKQTLLAVSKEW